MPSLWRLHDVRLTARAEAPPGYVYGRLCRLQLDWRLAALQVAIVPAAWFGFALLTAPLGGPATPRAGLALPRVGLLDLLAILQATVVVLPIVHELAHGLIAWLSGGRPVFGLGPGLAFCHIRALVDRNTYAVILGAPLVLLSVCGVTVMPLVPIFWRGPLLALLVANAAGAAGDLALLARVLPLPPGVLIADTREGFEVYQPTP